MHYLFKSKIRHLEITLAGALQQILVTGGYSVYPFFGTPCTFATISGQVTKFRDFFHIRDKNFLKSFVFVRGL